ncbi:MAG: diguanylate cyclase [Prochloraceae cyanobacterium]|nr:diguanylate cyclase [Prochloraceae cyanobacterium]
MDSLSSPNCAPLIRRLPARRLKQRIRSSDILARLGGDEFGLILYNCPLEEAEKIANNLLEIVREFRFTWENKTFNIGEMGSSK